jgi:hypothetical protein
VRDYGIKNPPHINTIGWILQRHGLVKKRKRKPGKYEVCRGQKVRGSVQ